MRYTLSHLVSIDLEEIADWIGHDSPRNALKMIQELRAAIRYIAQHPLQYQVRPEIGEDARLATVGSYVIMFWLDGDIVRIERIVHGSRDLPKLLQ